MVGSSGAAGAYEIERSVRFNKADSAAMSRTPSSAGNRKTWTFSCWFKKSLVPLSTGECIFTAKQNGSWNDVISIGDDEKLSFKQENNNTIKQCYSTRLIRDCTSWYHLVVTQDTTQSTAADRLKMWINGVQETLTGSFPNQDSDGNFNRDSVIHYLGATKASSNNNPDFEFNGYMAEIHFIDGQALDHEDFGEISSTTGQWIPKEVAITSPNDGTTWSSSGSDPHSLISSGSIANVFDSSLSTVLTATKTTTADNEWVTLCNNVSITAASTVGLYSDGGSSTPTIRINGSTNIAYSGSGSKWTDGSFSGTITKIEFAYLDGSGSSGNVYGVRVDGVQLIDGTNEHGKNGFYLNLSDNSDVTATTLGKDSSGNSNNYTPTGMSVTAGIGNDSLTDTPTNNHAILNHLTPSHVTLSNGNLDYSTSTANDCSSTFGVTTGKWYVEFTCNGAGNGSLVGIKNDPNTRITTDANQGTVCNVQSTNVQYSPHSTAADTTGGTWTTNDIIGIALDATSKTCDIYKNGSKIWGFTSFDIDGPYFFAFDRVSSSGGNNTHSVNFGQRAFSHQVAGYKALCAANLPAPTIKDGTKYFNTVLYTGNNNTSQNITGVGFQPNLVWVKNRDNVERHHWVDSVRGNNKMLHSEDGYAERTGSHGNGHTQLNLASDGFNLVSNGSNDELNFGTRTYVAWNWKEAATAGFDIVSYTGTGSAQTVSHSLGVAPEMMIIKNRDSAYHWAVYHHKLTDAAENHLTLSELDGAAGGNTWWNDTAPTSSVFTVLSANETNKSGDDYIAYLFSSVAGYSKVGSYTGNNNSNGIFIYTGFKPAYLMLKKRDADGSWKIFDNKRDPYNLTRKQIAADGNGAEEAYDNLDFVSNGIKMRNSFSDTNASAAYVYIAFAETPFKYANAR